MTPVAKTGLHCGKQKVLTGVEVPTVTPVAKTGLHCGTIRPMTGKASPLVTPVAKTGLHCGAVTRHRLLELRWTSDPGREDRAPLRLVEDGGDVVLVGVEGV